MNVASDLAVIGLSTASAVLFFRSDDQIAAKRPRAAMRRLLGSHACLAAAIVVAVAQCGLGS